MLIWLGAGLFQTQAIALLPSFVAIITTATVSPTIPPTVTTTRWAHHLIKGGTVATREICNDNIITCSVVFSSPFAHPHSSDFSSMHCIRGCSRIEFFSSNICTTDFIIVETILLIFTKFSHFSFRFTWRSATFWNLWETRQHSPTVLSQFYKWKFLCFADFIRFVRKYFAISFWWLYYGASRKKQFHLKPSSRYRFRSMTWTVWLGWKNNSLSISNLCKLLAFEHCLRH